LARCLPYIFILTIFAVSTTHAEAVTYAQALKSKKIGEYEIAEQQFRTLISLDNDNAELWFQLGLVQRFQQKRVDAFETQQRAMSLSPKNDDIKLELARLHRWNRNYDLAEAMVNEVLAANPDYTVAKELATSITRAKNGPEETEQKRPYKWQLDFGYENSDFSRRPQPDWHQYFLQIGGWIRNDTLVHLRTANIERRHIRNEHYEIGAAHIFNDTYNAHLSVGYTPDSLFIPEWRIKTGGEARVIFNNERLGNTWLTAHLQYDRYKNLNATVIKPGIRYQLLENWQIQAQHINVIDENNDHLIGWSVRLNWQTSSPKLRVFGGLSDAPETENTITVNTKARFGGFSYQVTPQIAAHASYASEDRDNSFIRNIVSTALSVKF
jgi:YaiO family outer membrane protein